MCYCAEDMTTTHWEKAGSRESKISVKLIDGFNARGMRRVYGRVDRFPGRHAFCMDVWLTRTGRLLARFWSRSSEVDGESWEVIGFFPVMPIRNAKHEISEEWVPECLRDKYNDWIISEF